MSGTWTRARVSARHSRHGRCACPARALARRAADHRAVGEGVGEREADLDESAPPSTAASASAGVSGLGHQVDDERLAHRPAEPCEQRASDAVAPVAEDPAPDSLALEARALEHPHQRPCSPAARARRRGGCRCAKRARTKAPTLASRRRGRAPDEEPVADLDRVAHRVEVVHAQPPRISSVTVFRSRTAPASRAPHRRQLFASSRATCRRRTAAVPPRRRRSWIEERGRDPLDVIERGARRTESSTLDLVREAVRGERVVLVRADRAQHLGEVLVASPREADED